MEQAEEEDFGSSSFGKWRSWMWNTIEYPWTSSLAQFLALFSLSMVILSTITLIVYSYTDNYIPFVEGFCVCLMALYILIDT